MPQVVISVFVVFYAENVAGGLDGMIKFFFPIVSVSVNFFFLFFQKLFFGFFRKFIKFINVDGVLRNNFFRDGDGSHGWFCSSFLN